MDLSVCSRILYKNEACIVLNKSAGEAVEGAKEGLGDLPLMIREQLNIDFAEAVHRLDVPVTGCSLFALNRYSLKYLNGVFTPDTSSHKINNPAASSGVCCSNKVLHSGFNTIGNAPRGGVLNPSARIKTVNKKYWAITEKPVEKINEEAELVHWIETNPKINKTFAYNHEKKGSKKSVLKYKIKSEGQNYLFIEVELITGRHHQIRSQFAAIGLFIKGDLKYGAKRSEKNGGIRLHSRMLTFPNPLNKDETVTVSCDPPLIDNLWKEFIKIDS